ncbi:MAG: hypothetical protein ACI9KE_000662 [Polyangiales bacterium]|jgi:hypothetical protein
MWNFDLLAWHAEHKMALAELAEVAKLIGQHQAASSTHEQDIAKFAHEIKGHEQKLAEHCEKNPGRGIGEPAGELGHSGTSETADTLRRAHERIKKHHHTAMAHVASLKAALESAM